MENENIENNEVKTPEFVIPEEYKDEVAMIIEEFLNQRILGMKKVT